MATRSQNVTYNTFSSVALVEPQWLAVHTSSRHEQQVAHHCAARGIEHFLPLYSEVHRWSDRRVVIQAPLFPGYVFVRIPRQRRLAVLQVPGVANVVTFGGVPAAIETTEIDALKRGILGGVPIEPHPYLRVGTKVRVCGGPMRGVEGVLIKKRDESRVVISIDLIMRSVAVQIDPADLRVIA